MASGRFREPDEQKDVLISQSGTDCFRGISFVGLRLRRHFCVCTGHLSYVTWVIRAPCCNYPTVMSHKTEITFLRPKFYFASSLQANTPAGPPQRIWSSVLGQFTTMRTTQHCLGGAGTTSRLQKIRSFTGFFKIAVFHQWSAIGSRQGIRRKDTLRIRSALLASCNIVEALGNCAAGLIGSQLSLGNASAISHVLLGPDRLLLVYLDLVEKVIGYLFR